MFTSGSAFDFLSSKNWRLYCPLSMLRWRTFYHLSQLFCRIGLTITMLLSGKYYQWPREPGRMRSAWLFHLFFDRFLLALQKGWCITRLLKNSDRYRDKIPSLETVTLIEMFWGMDFIFLLVSFSFLFRGVTCWIHTATAGCSPCIRLN